MASTSTGGFRRRLGRVVLHVLDALVLALVAGLLYVGVVGVPDWVVRRILRPTPEQGYVLDVGRVRFSLVRGMVAQDVRLYPRRRIGPPVLEAREAVAEISLSHRMTGRPILSGISLEDGVVRLKMLSWANAGATSRSAKPQLALSLRLRNVQVDEVCVASGVGRFEGDSDAWSFRNAAVTLQHAGNSLDIRGDLQRDRAGDLGGRGSAEGDPHVLNPFFDAFRISVASRIINDFGFVESLPSGEWSFHVPHAPFGDFEVYFRVTGQNAFYRGVQTLRGDGTVELTRVGSNFTARIEPLVVVREEGVARGGMTFRHEGTNGVLEFTAESGIDPRAAAQMVGVWTNETRTILTFDPPYKMTGSGWVDLYVLDRAALDGRLSFGRLAVGAHEMKDCSFRLRMEGTTNQVDDLSASWFDGALTGRMEWLRAATPKAQAQYRMEFAVLNANFESIAASHIKAGKSEYSGRLSGHLALEGIPDNRASMQGKGDITITKGRIFLLPIFGGLSDYIASIIPGLDSIIGQSDLRADFTISDSRIRTSKVAIDGDVLSLLGSGSSGFDGTQDFDIQLTFLKSHTLLSKIIRVPTYVFSKLFEFKLTGTSAQPRWYPINFSKELWQRSEPEGKKNGAPESGAAPPFSWDQPW